MLLTPMHALNEHQQLAVEHADGPAMVLAGAGSGKTTVLTKRVAWLLSKHNYQPENIMVVTFTNKAAGEIKARITQETGRTLPFAGTFHSLCARILRKDGRHIDLNPDFVIFDTDDQKALLRQIYKERGIDPKRYSFGAIKSGISKAKNELMTPNNYQEQARGQFQEQVAHIYQWYQQGLRQASAVDFDDILLKALRLIKTVPEVQTRYQELLHHVLVDEYQDTNTAQYQLTKLLSAPHNNLYVVGDFSQSIYAWRGADYRNMMQLKHDFEHLAEYRLEQNYRSNQTILDAATKVIAHNTQHPILELWTEQSSGNQIMLIEAEDNRDEAQHIAQYVRQRHAAGTAYDDMAILYRTNAQSRAFEEAFMRAGIPYTLVGSTKFYERTEVKDIIAYARYTLNPDDQVSFERATKIGKRRLTALTAWKARQTPDELRVSKPAALISAILEVTSYADKYKKKSEDDLQRLENINELVAVAGQFDTLTQLLENIALIQDDTFVKTEAQVAGVADGTGGVRVMSLHSAKGLEFDTVFLVGMEDGLLPHSRSFLDPSQMEEERRLCYVGITRAKNMLYCSYARRRFQYGSSTQTTRSRFLQDIPNHLLEFVSSAAQQSGRGTYNNSAKNNQSSSLGGRRYVPVDEDLAAGVLSDEFDLDTFIES